MAILKPQEITKTEEKTFSVPLKDSEASEISAVLFDGEKDYKNLKRGSMKDGLIVAVKKLAELKEKGILDNDFNLVEE